MSRIETLEAAFDEMDAADVAPEQAPAEPAAPADVAEAAPEPSQAQEPAQSNKPERARDEAGKFAKEKPAPKAKPVEHTPPAPATPAPVAAPPVQQPPQIKAPQSWKPAEREAWHKVPPEAQAAIARREKEIAVALQQAAESGKGIQPWQEAVRPYEAQIRAAGMEPVAYVGDLLKTAHALTYSAPQQKAGLLADLIMQFGVQPGDLDQALVARMNGRPAAPQEQQQFRDPRFDQLLQQMESAKQARAQAMEQDAQSRIEAFAQTHEFYADVAPTMAEYLDVWGKQGMKEVTEHDFERAYNRACMDHPEIAGIMEQRKKAEAVRTSAEATARAKAAASSVRSQPTGGQSAQPVGRLEVLQAAYDEIASR